ncbi:MAG: cytochrome c-type biogenesis protein CcmH [Acidobacteria bacterium]|nr:cytochrome c-type biogenesis protein CcmH [Acidobacteriota bacterium]
MRRRASGSRPEWLGRAASAVALTLAAAALVPALLMAFPGTAHSDVEMTPTHGPQVHGSLEDVTKGLMCTCGCNLTVAACRAAMTCEVAAKMQAVAADLLDKGLDKKAILASFVADYGERVLASPTKKGFNLTAWVLPFAGLAGGALMVGVALRRWRPRVAPVEAPPPVDAAYVAEIEEEIRKGL